MTTTSTGRIVKISEPDVSLERIYDRLNFAEKMLAEYEALGFTACAKMQRRRIGGLKSAATRIGRML